MRLPSAALIRASSPRSTGFSSAGVRSTKILAKLRELGVSDVSRSALGRYKQSYDEVIASVRESRQVAEVLVKEFGKDSDPKAMRANIEMMQALISRLTREITRNEKLDVKHATIASRQGSCPFSGNFHGFHGMKRCFQRIGVHSKECPNDTSGSTSHCSNLAHHGMSFMNISHSFAIRDEVYGSSYNYDTGKLLSQFLSLFLTS